jgi:hypothetical protein
MEHRRLAFAVGMKRAFICACIEVNIQPHSREFPQLARSSGSENRLPRYAASRPKNP